MKKISRIIVVSWIVVLFMLCGVKYDSPTDAVVYAANKNEIHMSTEKKTMYVGEKLTLTLKGSKGKVTWASSKPKVAKVSSKGSVTALKAGTANITAIYNGESFQSKITVKNPSLNKSEVTLMVGEQHQIKTLGTKASSYISSKTKVAKVSTSGKITAKSEGTATISVKCQNGKTYKCKVIVKSEDELSAKEIYNKCCNSVVEVDAGEALGSGFFITKNQVVTNYHVITDATSLKIRLLNGKEYDVLNISGYSKELDLAILEVNYTGVPLEVNSHGVTMGETTYTIGSSLGLTNTYSNGMVSNTERIFDGVKYIQTNTAISQGNSGGPLINVYGEVMGVTTSSFVEGQNLNLAVNITHLFEVDESSPITVEAFLKQTQTKPTHNVGTNTGAEKPDFDAVVYYGEESGERDVVGIAINNYGTKELIVGGDQYSNFVHVYPYEGAEYSVGTMCDEDAEMFREIYSKTIAPGEIGYFYVVLEETRFFTYGASAAFFFTYDGVEYIAIADDEGNAVFEIANL